MPKKTPLQRKDFRLGLLSTSCLVATSFLVTPVDQAKAQNFVMDTDGQSESIAEGEVFDNTPIVSWEGANNATFENFGTMNDEGGNGFLVEFMVASDGNSITVQAEGDVTLNNGAGFLSALGNFNSFSNFSESFNVTDNSGNGNPVVQSVGDNFSFLNEGFMDIDISGTEEMTEPFSIFSFIGDDNEAVNNGGIEVGHAVENGGGSEPGDYRVFNFSGMGTMFTNNAEVSIDTDYTAFVWSEGNVGDFFENGTVENSGYGGLGYHLTGNSLNLTVTGQILMTGGGSVGVFLDGSENSLFVDVGGVISSTHNEMAEGEMYNVGFWATGTLGNFTQQYRNLGLIEATGSEAVAVRIEGGNHVFVNDFLPSEEVMEEDIGPEFVSEGYSGTIYANALGFGEATGVEIDGPNNIFTNRGLIHVENQGEFFVPNENGQNGEVFIETLNVEGGFSGVAGFVAYGTNNTLINEANGEIKVNGLCEGECENADALGVGFFPGESGSGDNSLFNDGKIVAVGEDAYGIVSVGDNFTFIQGEEGFLHAVGQHRATGLVSEGDNAEIFLGGQTLIIGGKEGGGGEATGVIIEGSNNNFGMGSSLVVSSPELAQGIVNIGAGNTYNLGSDSYVNVNTAESFGFAIGFTSVNHAELGSFIEQPNGNTTFTNAGEFYVNSKYEEYAGGDSIGFIFLGDNNSATFTSESYVGIDGGTLSIGAIYAGFNEEFFNVEEGSLGESLAPLFGSNNSFTNNGNFHVTAMEESFAFSAGLVQLGDGFDFLNTGSAGEELEVGGGLSTQDIEEFDGGFSSYAAVEEGFALNIGVLSIGRNNSIVNEGDMAFGASVEEGFALSLGILSLGLGNDILNNGNTYVAAHAYEGGSSFALGIGAFGDGNTIINDRINFEPSVLDVYGYEAVGALVATSPFVFEILPEGTPALPESEEDLVGNTFINRGIINVATGAEGEGGFAAGVLIDGYFHDFLNVGEIYVEGGWGIGVGTIPPGALEEFEESFIETLGGVFQGLDAAAFGDAFDSLEGLVEGEVLTGYSIGGTFENRGLINAFFSGYEEYDSFGVGIYGYDNAFLNASGATIDFYGNGYGVFLGGGGNIGVNDGTIFAATGEIECFECLEENQHVVGIALESPILFFGPDEAGPENIEIFGFGNTFTNNGEVFVVSEGSATGVYMDGYFNSFFNNGLIEVIGGNESFGIDAFGGFITFENTGTIKLFNNFEDPNDGALGMFDGHDIFFDNTGLIDGSMPLTIMEGEILEQSTPFLRGLEFFLETGPIVVLNAEENAESGPPLVFNNSGTILTTGFSFFGSPGVMGSLRPGYQTVFVGGEGEIFCDECAQVDNIEEGGYPQFVEFRNALTGVIDRTGEGSVAVFIDTPYDWYSDIDNLGTISGGYGSLFTGIGHDDILNRGTLQGDVDTDHVTGGMAKIPYECEEFCEEMEMGGDDTILNQGNIFGNVYMRGGNDTFNNQGIVESDVDLGDGDDNFIWGNSNVDGEVFGGEGFDHFEFNGVGTVLNWDSEKFHDFEALWITGDTLVIPEGEEAFFDEASVDGGVLQVDGFLSLSGGMEEGAGTLFIQNGGILQGGGVVDASIDNEGGNILPGGSIGTIIVLGDFIQGPGGSITFEVNADGSNDFLDVTGDAFLDGEIVIVLENTNLPFMTPGTFTLIETGGEVFGGFATVSGLDGTFWDPNLFINPQDVILQLTLESFNQPTGTPSQQNAGTILDSKIQTFGDGSMLGMYLFDLANTQMTQAGPVIDMAFNHGASNLPSAVFQNLGTLMNQVAQYNNHVQQGQWSTFVTGFGQFGNYQTDGNAPGFKYDGSGGVVGITYGAGSRTKLGVFAGASFINMDTYFLGHDKYDDVQIGLFGEWTQTRYRVEGVVIVGFGDFDTTRAINTGAGSPLGGSLLAVKTAVGTTDTTSFGAHVEVDFLNPFNGALNASWIEVTPAVMVDVVHINMDGFTETGNVGDLGLVINEVSSTEARFAAGANANILNTGRFHPTVGMFYVFNAGDRDRAATAGFIADPSMPFTYFGVRPDTHAARLNAGINVDMGSNIWFGVNYNGYFSGVEEAHRIDGTLKWIW